MSSLRLALKQSLEETSASTSPPTSQQVAPVAGRASPHGGTTGSVTSPPTGDEEDPMLSHLPKKRGPGRPRKHPQTGDQHSLKRGRPRKQHVAGDGHDDDDDENDFSSENEFSVGENRESEHHRRPSSSSTTMATAAASKIQSHWKKSKGKDPEASTGSVSTASTAPRPSKQQPGRPKEAASAAAAVAPMVNQSKPVTPPTAEVVEWMRNLSIKRARKAVCPGLRVKVRFLTNKKKDGRIIRKRIWYGGKITQVSKEGSKIKIKYDDKTSEVTQFPDKDVVIDDYLNGTHHARADRFIPPESNEAGDDEGITFEAEREQKAPQSAATGKGKASTSENRDIPPEPVQTVTTEGIVSERNAKPSTGEEKDTSLPGKAGFILPKSVAERSLASTSAAESAGVSPSLPQSSQHVAPERKAEIPSVATNINAPSIPTQETSVSVAVPNVPVALESSLKPAESTEMEKVNASAFSSTSLISVPVPDRAVSPSTDDVLLENKTSGTQAEKKRESLSNTQPMEVDKSDNLVSEAVHEEVEHSVETKPVPTVDVEKPEESPAHDTYHEEKELPNVKVVQTDQDRATPGEEAVGTPEEFGGSLSEKTDSGIAPAENAVVPTLDKVLDGTGQTRSPIPPQIEEHVENKEAAQLAEFGAIASSFSSVPSPEAMNEKSDIPKASVATEALESKKDGVDSALESFQDGDSKEVVIEPGVEGQQDTLPEALLEETADDDHKPKRKRGRPPKHRPYTTGPSEGESEVQSEGTELASDPKSTESGVDTAAKPSLTIHIPNLKKIRDETVGSDETDALRGKKRSSDDLEEEPPAKRLHIHIGPKLVKPNDLSEKPIGSPRQLKDPAMSPRLKKVKRKRDPDTEAVPVVGTKTVDKHSGKVEDTGDRVPREVQSERDTEGPTPVSEIVDDMDETIKADLLLAARSERRAAQQANERMSSKSDVPPDQLGKKKKKKRREREEGEPELEEEKWVQCDKCKKWRIIPSSAVDSLPPMWYCADNKWDPKRASCDVREQTDKEVLKLRKRKKRKLMMEREAAEAAAAAAVEGTRDSSEGRPGEATTIPAKNDDSKVPHRASPAAVSADAALDTTETLRIEKKSAVSGKKTKQPNNSTPAHPGNEEESKPRGRGRPRRNPPKEPSTPSAQPATFNSGPSRPEEAENVEWVQCEKCEKWRKLPPHISADELPDVWYCTMNTWNPGAASCSAPEDKADGLQDIFNNESSGKLSYRNLIFGSNGRKHNRPISERTRAAESLFAAVSEDSDAPPTVMYANSSSFVCRGKSQSTDENQPRLLDVMADTHFWATLQKSQASVGPIIFDDLSAPAREAMKDIVLHHLEAKTLTGEELHRRIQERNWDDAPAGWTAVRKYCTEDMLVMAMCELVRLGVLECYRLDGPFPNGQLWTLCYRRAKVRASVTLSDAATVGASSPATLSPSTGSSRCMKIAKPWKRSMA